MGCRRVLIVDLDAHQGDGHERDFSTEAERAASCNRGRVTRGEHFHPQDESSAHDDTSILQPPLQRVSSRAARRSEDSLSADTPPSDIAMGRVWILDAFRPGIFPSDTPAAHAASIRMHVVPFERGSRYVASLASILPRIIRSAKPDLVLYNAGSDILDGDPLSGLNISPSSIIQRDLLVCQTCGVVGPLLEERIRSGETTLEQELGEPWVLAGCPRIPVAMLLSGGYQ